VHAYASGFVPFTQGREDSYQKPTP
jgi:hypothetical protein